MNGCPHHEAVERIGDRPCLRGMGRNLAGLRPLLTALPFLLPAYAIFLVFEGYPILHALWLSFHAEDPFGREQRWVGLAHYTRVLSSPEFWQSVWVTAKFCLIVVPLQLTLGLLAALLVYRPYPGVVLFRTLFFLTTAVPTAVAAVAWGWLLHPEGGWLNRALGLLGCPPSPG